MKNILKISCIWQTRKKYTFYNSIFLAIILLLTIGFGSYYVSSKNYIKNDIYKSSYFNTLQVSKGTNNEHKRITIEVTDEKKDTTEQTAYESQINYQNNEQITSNNESIIEFTQEELDFQKRELKNIKNVVNVSNDYAYWNILYSDTLKTKKLDGGVGIYSATNATLPEIAFGTNFPDEEGNYLVCPENFYPSSNFGDNLMFSIFDKINTKNLLNTTITFPYSSTNNTKNFEMNYKIVGFYKNSNYNFDENICYATNKSMMEIALNEYSDDIDITNNINNIVYQTTFFVQVDKLENIESVKEILTEMGYSYEPVAFIAEDDFHIIENNMKKNTILVLLIGFVILIIILWKQFGEDKANYKLLNYLGYNRKNIEAIFIFSTIIQILLSLILSAIIILLLFGIIILGLNIYPFLFNKWTLYINTSASLFVILIMIIAAIVNIIMGIITLKKDFNEINNI